MATMTYKEQYLHPNWQRKRLEVMQDAGFECENCGDSDTTLNVHHKRYVKGRMVWEYERNELACLCEPCHKSEHEQREVLDLLLVAGGQNALMDVIGLLGGLLEGDLSIDDGLRATAMGIAEPTYELGLFVSIFRNFLPDYLAKAVDAIGEVPMTPTQTAAVQRWRDFAERLEKSGL